MHLLWVGMLKKPRLMARFKILSNKMSLFFSSDRRSFLACNDKTTLMAFKDAFVMVKHHCFIIINELVL